MGKNLPIGDIIVGKIKQNLNRSGCVVQVVGVGHKCWIHVKWSDSTKKEEVAWGIDRDGLAEENRQHKMQKRFELIEDDEGYSEVSSSHKESESNDE